MHGVPAAVFCKPKDIGTPRQIIKRKRAGSARKDNNGPSGYQMKPARVHARAMAEMASKYRTRAKAPTAPKKWVMKNYLMYLLEYAIIVSLVAAIIVSAIIILFFGTVITVVAYQFLIAYMANYLAVLTIIVVAIWASGTILYLLEDWNVW